MMRLLPTSIAALGLALGLITGGCSPEPLPDGRYLLSLRTGTSDAPAIETTFDLETIGQNPERCRAVIRNGPERIEVPVVERSATTLLLGFPHYDARVYLESAKRPDGRVGAEGTWRIDRGDRGVATLDAVAVPVDWIEGTRRPAIAIDRDAPEEVSGRWAITFDQSGEAIGEFEVDRYGGATGTVRTPTGDYRYLAGRYEPTLREWGPGDPILARDVIGTLELSTFDGAHAFTIVGNRQRDGKMWGLFASGDWWIESWGAEKDAAATLPDPFAESVVSDASALESIAFRDADTGAERRVVDVLDELGGKARIVEIFGTWCPNCTDAARELVDLRETHPGLAVVGVAFEATSDFERSARQVRRYQERHGADWPVLVAGNRDKADATKTFRALDRVRSYPTMLFMNEHNEVVEVLTGFNGPATGEAYREQRARIDAIIQSLLND
ncbi:MAG: TlpA disulfide reductase family protein [Phycisphaerales bacterium]